MKTSISIIILNPICTFLPWYIVDLTPLDTIAHWSSAISLLDGHCLSPLVAATIILLISMALASKVRLILHFLKVFKMITK